MKQPRTLNPLRMLLIVLSMLICGSVLVKSQRAARSYRSPQSSAPVTPTAFSQPTVVKRYQEVITPTMVASHLYFLASDFFEGRGTATPGQKLAAQYLASQYRLIGAAPKGTVKTADLLSPAAYLQPFTIYRGTPKEARLEVMVNGSSAVTSSFSAENHDDFSYFLSGSLQNATGGVVFAGYGIADDKLGYNDYSALSANGISIDGKWLLILADEPLADSTTSLLPTPEHKLSSWSTQFINKRIAMWKAGVPKGILVVSDASPRQRPFSAQAVAASLNAQRIGPLSLDRFSSVTQTFAISSSLATRILAPAGYKIEDLKQQINRSLKPAVFDISGVTVNSTVEQAKEWETENVVALIEGSDPKLKDEVIVISSHYDHLGINRSLSGDQVFNGAADDGSGVVASLALAQAFMNAKREGFGPRRSILFINFTGEEVGHLGSLYYANTEPLVPLEKTVADINMDGVGGIDPKHPTGSKNYIYISGDDVLSQELIDINKRVKSITGSSVELTDAPAGFNSDHSSFQNQLIPFIYYSTGFTEHYHTPRDEPNTIDYDHLARVTKLIFAAVWQVANQDARIRHPNVDRSAANIAAFICPPCSLECDSAVYDHPGTCPVCGMRLIPKYSAPGGKAK